AKNAGSRNNTVATARTATTDRSVGRLGGRLAGGRGPPPRDGAATSASDIGQTVRHEDRYRVTKALGARCYRRHGARVATRRNGSWRSTSSLPGEWRRAWARDSRHRRSGDSSRAAAYA